MARQFQVPVTLHKRQKEIFDDKTRRRIVAAGRRFGKCLVGDTKIMMADGSEKEIRDLKKGDMITSYDEKTNQYVKRRVRRVVSNGKRAVLKVSTEYRHIRCTVQHPFFTQGTWTKAGRLTPRSSLTIFDGIETSFESVKSVKWDGEEETFDLEIENTPTFIANGIVTHNTALARSEILRAASNPGWNVWYVAPTYRMAKQIMWRDLMREIPRGWIKAANATVMDITLKNGSVISLRGADKPDSLRGVEVNFLVMDEMQDIKPIAWEEALRPTLAKTRGRVLFLGCVAADTQVITAHGARDIGSFDEKNGEKSLTPLNVSVYGIDQSWSEADGFFDNGEVPTRRIITKRGYSLESSLPHPVLVMSETGEIEWKKTSCLKIGDRVAIDRNNRHGFVGVKAAMQGAIDKEIKAGNLGEGSQFGPNRLYFLGLWTACGEIHGTGRVTVTTREKVLREYLSRQMNEHGDGFYQSNDRRFRYFCNSSVFVRLMKAACSDWATSPNKRRFPEVMAQARPGEIRSFVAGLIDGAGFTHSQYGHAQYSSTERNCRDLQLLLLRCGIISTVKIVGENWFLFISGKDGSQFSRTFPVKLKKKTALPEDDDLVYSDDVPFAGRLVETAFEFKTEDAVSYKKLQAMMRFGGKNQVAKKKIERILAQNYFWDEVKSLIVGFRHTYDFTIPATHSFWSNGFISHNTPKSRNYFYKLYKMGQNKDYQRAGIYKSWQIPTIESPFIPEAEIEEARADMDPRSFRQEFMANFETITGSVYYNFNREAHVKPCAFNPGLPIWVGQDFNVSPMSSVIMQPQPNGELWVVDEIYQFNSNTLSICNELERRYWKYMRQVTIYPDPAGGSRSTARGETDLDIFRERGFRRIKYRKQHPLVADRVNCVNKLLMNAEGKVTLRIDPKCKNLIESFEQTAYKEGTNEIDKRLSVEHITDAIGYPIEIEYPRHKIELIGVSI